MKQVLDDFIALACTKALGTNLDTLDSASIVDLYLLNISIPFAPGMAVGVRYIVAAHLALTTNLTFS